MDDATLLRVFQPLGDLLGNVRGIIERRGGSRTAPWGLYI